MMLPSTHMRTTVNLDADVEAAVAALRASDGIGVSEAVNRLARAGLTAAGPATRYEHRTADLGLAVDVTNIGDVLDLLDEA